MSTTLPPRQTLLERLRHGAADWNALLRAPQLLLAGLRRKGVVPALLLLSLLLVPVTLVPLSDAIVEWLYPPVEGTTLFGLLGTSREDERLEPRKTQAAVLVWLLAGVGVSCGLLLYAPKLRLAGAEALPWKEDSGGSSLPRRYRITGEVGRGAMGIVYSAVDTHLEREVALKELPAFFLGDRQRRERFRREALTLARLSHPGIVQIYDLLDQDGRLVLVMELVKGGTLEQRLTDHGRFPVREACRAILEIAATLDYMHRNQVMHRDLKPANILFDVDGRLKVTDFGLARLLQDSGMTLDGSVMGSPSYMSPEQAGGRPTDQRADFYALGAIFYHLLTGEPPFTGEPAAVLLHQLNDAPLPPQQRVEDLDPKLAQVALDLMQKEPSARLADADELAKRLQRFAR